ncbi:PAS domain-containing sensor histidine kinase [Roseospira goensis]|uniref:histidine kinase n=1 Tax=Roseospira goensis TaxID=391922 RepID=A0A7W6WK68_9PROT|nr:PAS domain-containing protein [Roseospira goensis]MBB4285253.1 PAS domain S-box-containing protein [Roseospira goensis]
MPCRAPGLDATVRSLRRRQQALEALAGDAALDDVLAEIARSVEEADPAAGCAVLVCEPSRTTLRAAAVPTLPGAVAGALAAVAARGWPDRLAGTDARGTPPLLRAVWPDVRSRDLPAAVRAALDEAGVRAVWWEPVTDDAGTVLGVVAQCLRHPGPPVDAALEPLVEAARLSGLAIARRRAEATAEERAAWLASGQSLANLGSFAFDLDRRRWWISENWVHHIGVDSGDLSDAALRALVHPADLAAVDAVIARALDGTPQTYEHRLLHARTGAVLHVRGVAKRVTGARGTPVQIVGVVQDVTVQARALDALAAGEVRFRRLFDNLPLFLALWRRDGDDFVLTDVNRASEELTGGQAHASLGRRLSAFYADLPWMRDMVWRSHTKGLVEATESLYPLRATGEVRHFALKVVPVPPDMVLVIAEDIGQRKRAEQRLRETATLLTQAEQLADAGSWEWDCVQGRGTVSENWCRLHGFDEPPLTPDSYLPVVHPEDRPGLEAAFETAIRTGTDYTRTHRIIHGASGEVRHIKVRGMPVRDETGTVVVMQGVAVDVTEQVRHERALAQHLTHLQLAQRIARVGSWTYDPAVGVQSWSDEVYRIYERDPARGAPGPADYEALHAGEAFAAFRTAMREAIHAGVPFELTLRLDLPDGRQKWIHALGQPEPQRGPAGHVVHGTVQDVTDRKRAEVFRDDVERIVRHDLRSPIAATLAGIAILRLGETLTEDQRRTLDMMERANQRQLTMLDTSMALHRMEAGTYPLDPVPVPLGTMVGEVVEELRYLAEARGAAVTVEDGRDLWAMGEVWLCRTLLSNLVRNALEALPESGQTVAIALTAEAGAAVVRITNPGAVPDDIRDRFFEKFVTSGKAGGTGLGTYSAAMMARAQGGRVDLDASVSGRTTVTVRLPMAEPAVTTSAAD